MSLVSLATAAEKWLVLRRGARESARFLTLWRERLSSAGVAQAADSADAVSRTATSHTWLPPARGILAAHLTPDAEREAYDRTVAPRHARRRLRRCAAASSVLATVGSTAPFVGLVGTVVGIVNAFQQIAATGQGGVGQVSAGIAEALVTTAFGIGVAIPAVWLFNHLTQWIGRDCWSRWSVRPRSWR